MKQTKVSRLQSSPLVMLKGKSGILELMVEYAGSSTPQALRIIRKLICCLSAFLEEEEERK